MNLSKLFKKLQPKQDKFLTINISSSDIKCLAVYKDGQNMKIIGRGQSILDAGAVRNGIIVDKNHVEENLQNSVTQATQNLEEKITNTIIGITGDLCQEIVTTAKITRGDLSPITVKEIDGFQKKVVDSAYLQIQKDYAETTGSMDTDFDLVTSSVVYTKIDNQKTDDPYAKTGQNIELALYMAFCPKHHLDTIKRIFKKLGLNILAVSSQSFALLKALKQTDLEYTDLVLLQTGSDFTNICVVFGNSVVSSKNLHIGSSHFVEQIGRKMGLTASDSKKILYTYLKGELGQTESSLVKKCLDDVLEIWLEGIKLIFQEFTGVKTFAPLVYLYDEGALIPEISDYLNQKPWTKSIPFKNRPKIVLLDTAHFPKILDATGSTLPSEYIPTAGLAYIFEEIL